MCSAHTAQFLFTGLPRHFIPRNDTAGAVKQNRAVREGCGKDEVRRRHIRMRRWRTFNLLDCFVISFLAMTEILARVVTADFRPCYIYLSCTASTLVIASVARQSSKNNACAIRRTSIIYYLLSIIYYLLSIIYYLCSNKNPPIRAVFI